MPGDGKVFYALDVRQAGRAAVAPPLGWLGNTGTGAAAAGCAVAIDSAASTPSAPAASVSSPRRE
jgi:hypothetical protein